MAQRNSNYERKPRDFYGTPSWVTELVLPYIRASAVVWEPACGTGAMTRVLETQFPTISTDVEPGPDHAAIDFFACSAPPRLNGQLPSAIVTNPPYDKAQEFTEHALALMQPVDGMVAMLMRIDWDSASTRRHLFADCPAWSKKLVLTKRILWFKPPPGSTGKSPSENHAWMLWDWQHRGPATIDYANPSWREAAE